MHAIRSAMLCLLFVPRRALGYSLLCLVSPSFEKKLFGTRCVLLCLEYVDSLVRDRTVIYVPSFNNDD
jgi:hypothetical protein